MTIIEKRPVGNLKYQELSLTNNNLKNDNWKKTLVSENISIQDAILRLDQGAQQILMVVNSAEELIGTITDGDIRRALLDGKRLDSKIVSVMNQDAFVVPDSMAQEVILKIMTANSIRQIPIISEERKVVGLHTWENLNVKTDLSYAMVIMAGGLGSRLYPLTENCPKPLLPVYGKPILEHILSRAIAEGFSSFFISVNYLSEMIEDYFGDGRRWGVNIKYLYEDKPLGTAGALKNLENLVSAPFVITNGDVLTHMRYSEFLDFHINHSADATMAVRVHEWQNPFGVVNIEGLNIVGLDEKPISRSHINAGIYALNPAALEHLKEEQYCDMTTLFERIRKTGNKTVAYPMHESWIDIGRPNDFELAEDYVQEKSKSRKVSQVR